jgi:hypothetical protein
MLGRTGGAQHNLARSSHAHISVSVRRRNLYQSNVNWKILAGSEPLGFAQMYGDVVCTALGDGAAQISAYEKAPVPKTFRMLYQGRWRLAKDEQVHDLHVP